YQAAGAEIVPDAAAVYGGAEMVVKVKEPLPPEYPLLRDGLILFTYLHLAPVPDLTTELLSRKVIGIAYETVQEADGRLPLLAPMSEVAGRLAIQEGARFLTGPGGGRGVLLGGVPGVAPGRVVIIGSGTVGRNAARMAVGLGASVTILGRDPRHLAALDDLFQGRVTTLASNRYTIEAELRTADLVVGAALVPGRAAPKLIPRELLASMPKGSVLVDVAIDQGGIAETSRPTTHSDPVYEVDGVINYCVANMPGAVPRTSTFALTNATLPYAKLIADKGAEQAARSSKPLLAGINVWRGVLTNREVAESQGREWEEPTL
ncbi:MAG: alanine dehydrogenase, partial [Desulfobacteraceae bacterium]|nr:alanine dehydrogenase [Desulfobacteraceae bacterium]